MVLRVSIQIDRSADVYSAYLFVLHLIADHLEPKANTTGNCPEVYVPQLTIFPAIFTISRSLFLFLADNAVMQQLKPGHVAARLVAAQTELNSKHYLGFSSSEICLVVPVSIGSQQRSCRQSASLLHWIFIL